MNAVLGKDVQLYVYRDAVAVLTVCATNLTRRKTSGSVSRLVRGAGKNRLYSGTIKEEQLNLEGLITLDELPKWQYEDFEVGENYDVLITYTNVYGDKLALNGNVLVTGIDDNNGAADFSSYSISMIRNGAWTKAKTYDNILVDGLGNPILDGNGDLIRV